MKKISDTVDIKSDLELTKQGIEVTDVITSIYRSKPYQKAYKEDCRAHIGSPKHVVTAWIDGVHESLECVHSIISSPGAEEAKAKLRIEYMAVNKQFHKMLHIQSIPKMTVVWPPLHGKKKVSFFSTVNRTTERPVAFQGRCIIEYEANVDRIQN